MANGLSELLARIKELPDLKTVQVIIPRGMPVTLADGVHYDADLYEIPSSLFAAPALPAPPGDAPQPERFMVASSTLNVRQSADRDSALVGKIAAGERVAVTGEAIGGYVKLSSREGYVLASGLTGA